MFVVVVAAALILGCGGGEGTGPEADTSVPAPDIPAIEEVGEIGVFEPDTGRADAQEDTDESNRCAPCDDDGDCASGYTCATLLDGTFCLLDCANATDCDEGDLCTAGEDGDGLCRPPDDACLPCPPGMQRNACGGCAVLESTIGDVCGSCDTGVWACDGVDAVECAGDQGTDALNQCGGCGTIEARVGTRCGPCLDGTIACFGLEDTRCVGAGLDSDNDGVCDYVDDCPGEDDRLDQDSDGVPDACDPCPLDRRDDSDRDGVCDSDDACPGFDDALDQDDDGVPDDCDRCRDFDDTQDEDGDGTPDACDCDATACPTGSACTESASGVSCPCLTGWEEQGDTCVEIDECERGTDNCDPIALCENTVGSFECHCPSGWTGDGTVCTDVNECARLLDDCDANATCENSVGSYDCSCNIGYSGDGRTCTLNNTSTFNFPAPTDTFDVASGDQSFALPDDRVDGSRSPDIVSISRVSSVTVSLARNDIVDTGEGCFGTASLRLFIGGVHFGNLLIRSDGSASFQQPTPAPTRVFGPPYTVAFETVGVLCGSFEFAAGGATINVAR